MRVEIRKSVIKDFKKIPEPYKSKIKEKITLLEKFPELPNIKKLTNYTPAYRLRVGNYRILFDVYDDHIEVARIKHRKESYWKTKDNFVSQIVNLKDYKKINRRKKWELKSKTA